MAFCRFCGNMTKDGSDECATCAELRHPSIHTVPPPSSQTGYAHGSQADPTGQGTYQKNPHGINPVPLYQKSATNTPTHYTSQYAPLGAWAYFGYALLFSIPIVGLIFLLIFSFNDANINRRNYARSWFCYVVVVLIAWGLIVEAGYSLADLVLDLVFF